MQDQRTAVEKVRPILQAIEHSIEQARRSRMHPGQDPAMTWHGARDAQNTYAQTGRLRARPKYGRCIQSKAG